MPKNFEYTEVHQQGPGEGIRTNSPDLEMAVTVGQIALERVREYASLEEFLAATNINEKYQEEINAIEGQFKKDGLEIAPISILKAEDYMQAATLTQRQHGESHQGEFMAGHVIVAENTEAVEAFGPNHVLSVGLHEAAHSTQTEHNVVVSRNMAEQDPESDALLKRMAYSVQQGGFSKYSWAPEEEAVPYVHGSFYEEAYADLKRVRSLREMGKSWGLPGKCMLAVTAANAPGNEGGEEVKTVYVGSGRTKPLVNDADGTVSIPAEFAMGAKVISDTKGALNGGPSNMAAYGVELLDQQVPGLFEDMEAARTDPNAYRSFVKKIESVKPGLYKELRDLDYTGQDFKTGLVNIAQALNLKQMEVAG